jgi:hypothetical protein
MANPLKNGALWCKMVHRPTGPERKDAKNPSRSVALQSQARPMATRKREPFWAILGHRGPAPLPSPPASGQQPKTSAKIGQARSAERFRTSVSPDGLHWEGPANTIRAIRLTPGLFHCPPSSAASASSRFRPVPACPASPVRASVRRQRNRSSRYTASAENFPPTRSPGTR